ncbi:tetraspanin-36-like [Excalfactoria chinensis]|uniref:tetraspanin-36-like n=1 Tax=Excalfactoria chinensis TaxID=46218 RepID=UPI003B3A3C8A
MWRVRSARVPLWFYEDSWLRIFARFLLLFLGVIFWASAAALAFGGCFVILFCKNYHYFFQEFFFPLPGWLAVVTALILLPTGILAVSVSTRNSRYHQGTLMYLLLVLLCLQVSLAVLTQFYSVWMAVELKSTMGQAFKQYDGTHSLARGSGTVDTLQKKLQCCGLQNYTDWLNASAAFSHFPSETSHVPRSCCKKYVDCGSDLHQLDQLFQEGCLGKLQDQIHYGMSFLFFCCVVLGVLELLAGASNGILMSCQPFYDFRFLESSVFS